MLQFMLPNRPRIHSPLTVGLLAGALLVVPVGCGPSDQASVSMQFANALTARDRQAAALMNNPAPLADIAETLGFAPLPASVALTGTTPNTQDQNGTFTITWHVQATRDGQTLANKDVAIALKLVQTGNLWLVDSSSVRVLQSIHADLTNMYQSASESDAEAAKTDFENGLAWLPGMSVQLASNVEKTDLDPIYEDDNTRLSNDDPVVVDAGLPREETAWSLVLVTPSGEQRLDLGSAVTNAGSPAHLARGTLDESALEQGAYSTAVTFADAVARGDVDKAQSMFDSPPAVTPAGWQQMAAELPTLRPLEEMSFDFDHYPQRAANGSIGLVWSADRAKWLIEAERTGLVLDARKGNGKFAYEETGGFLCAGDTVEITMPQVILGRDPASGEYLRADFVASSTATDPSSGCFSYSSATIDQVRVSWSGNSAGITLTPQVDGETAYQQDASITAVIHGVPTDAQNIEITILRFGSLDVGNGLRFTVDN